MGNLDGAITLIFLAFSAVYCFAVIRWTRGLPVWLRRLTRSLAMALLFPALVLQEEGVPFAPSIFFFTLDLPNLKWDDVDNLAFQTMIIWLIIFGLWTVIAEAPRLYREDPKQRRIVRRAAILCSLPLWMFIGFLFATQCYIGTGDSADLDSTSALICLISALFGMASIAMILFSMDEIRTARSDVLWTLWAACPFALLGFFLI
jgi:hypothetical protein